MGFIDFLSLKVICYHFWPYRAVFGPPWALGILKHLHKEPDVSIYPLAMAPAKKTPLILNSFHFHSFFFGVVVSGRFFTLLGPFWTPAGGKNPSKYDHIKPSPYFHPLTMRLAQKPSLFSDFDGFYRFTLSWGHFWPFLAISGHFWAPLSPRDSKTTGYGARPLHLASGFRTTPKNGLE